MSIIDKITALTRKVEQLKEKKMRNDIQKENILKELKEKYQLDSVGKAEKELKKMDEELNKKIELLEQDYDKFITEFGEKLGIN